MRNVACLKISIELFDFVNIFIEEESEIFWNILWSEIFSNRHILQFKHFFSSIQKVPTKLYFSNHNCYALFPSTITVILATAIPSLFYLNYTLLPSHFDFQCAEFLNFLYPSSTHKPKKTNCNLITYYQFLITYCGGSEERCNIKPLKAKKTIFFFDIFSLIFFLRFKKNVKLLL